MRLTRALAFLALLLSSTSTGGLLTSDRAELVAARRALGGDPVGAVMVGFAAETVGVLTGRAEEAQAMANETAHRHRTWLDEWIDDPAVPASLREHARQLCTARERSDEPVRCHGLVAASLDARIAEADSAYQRYAVGLVLGLVLAGAALLAWVRVRSARRVRTGAFPG